MRPRRTNARPAVVERRPFQTTNLPSRTCQSANRPRSFLQLSGVGSSGLVTTSSLVERREAQPRQGGTNACSHAMTAAHGLALGHHHASCAGPRATCRSQLSKNCQSVSSADPGRPACRHVLLRQLASATFTPSSRRWTRSPHTVKEIVDAAADLFDLHRQHHPRGRRSLWLSHGAQTPASSPRRPRPPAGRQLDFDAPCSAYRRTPARITGAQRVSWRVPSTSSDESGTEQAQDVEVG